MNKILLSHGSGGTHTRELIKSLFARHFANPYLDQMGDSAVLTITRANIAFTTDSYVVQPLFFPGGDIGKLAVCGTVNDLAVAGARAKYLSAGFIIEEGFEMEMLERIVVSMAKTAKEAGVQIVTGDTKVVEKGGADGLFINTAGIGEVFVQKPMLPSRCQEGDAIIINGTIADHGMAIMSAREGLKFQTTIQSDCAPLHELAERLVAASPETRFMRDATRGGLGAVLCEAVEGQNFGITIEEKGIPLRDDTNAVCEILGMDPLYVANEGKLVAFVPADSARGALEVLKNHPLGRDSAIIGHVTTENAGKVLLQTPLGTKRIVTMPSGAELPRIC